MREVESVTFSNDPMLSIIVPTLREAPNIPILTDKISNAVSQVIPSWELIIVDDNSRDGIVGVCDKLRRDGAPLRLIVRKKETGLATAVLRGFDVARAPIFVVMDADLSHPCSLIPVFYEKIQNGADFVIGSRYMPGGGTDDKWTVLRFINSKIATLLAMPLISVSDPMSGFFAIRRSLWRQCEDLSPLGYKVGLELIVKGKPKNLQEVPIHFRTRKFGESKLTTRQQLLYIRHLIRLYTYKWHTDWRSNLRIQR